MAFDPQDAVDFLALVAEAESSNRANGLADLRFAAGEQWPVDVQNSRALEARPCLTINKIDAHIRQVTNQQRQQRPRIKVHPMDSVADPKIAEILTGLTRHIEESSDAANAYDTAFNFAARIGWGYWRVDTDYLREDSFDQDIFVRQIENPFTVYNDPNSVLPDGSDSERCLITDLITKKAYELAYPGAATGGFTARSTGDNSAEWITREDIRIAEYFSVEKAKDRLVMLSDGSIHYASQLPKPEVLAKAGVSVTGDRESYRRQVMWRKVSAFEVLDEKKWDGRWIPIVPTYGDQMVIDGKRRKFGMVRFARDPQMMYNFWRTAMTESVAMAPKAKWIMAEGQDEGHENEWAKANVSAFPVLRYKMTDVDGREAGKPERIQPEPPPEGAMSAAMAISQDLQAVLGMFDPSMGKPSGPKSGTAIRAEQGQSEIGNFHYYDNLTRSIKHTGRIVLDLIPKKYDTHRIMRIIGDDGRPDLVAVNEPNPQAQQPQDPNAPAVQAILNDLSVGTYDVVMEVGPNFNSRRAEAAEMMSNLMTGNEKLMDVAGDLMFRNMDFPSADVIADRLAAANPMAQIDEKSDIPPQAQMQIKTLQQHLQQAQQQIQQMDQVIKTRSDVKKMEEDAETNREHMRQVTKAHDVDSRERTELQRETMENEAWAHDVQTKALTAVNVAEINQTGTLLAKHMDAKQLERQADNAERETLNT